MWKNKKIIFKKHHAQLPTPFYLGNGIIRIYYSTKIKQKSQIRFFDVCEKNLNQVSDDFLALEPGSRGTFSHAGVMPSCIVVDPKTKKNFMFYTGWHLCSDVPYGHSIGLSEIKADGTLQIIGSGPVLCRNVFNGYLVNSPCVWYDQNQKKWIMFYCGGTGWIENYPTYKIHKAEGVGSGELTSIFWRATGECVITHNIKDEAISRVWRNEKFFYYSIKTSKSNYKIMKTNLIKKEEIKFNKNKFDNEIQCYPAVYSGGGRNYMFYNGNNYGETGVLSLEWKK
jgi:hypothetical protein